MVEHEEWCYDPDPASVCRCAKHYLDIIERLNRMSTYHPDINVVKLCEDAAAAIGDLRDENGELFNDAMGGYLP